MDFYRKRELKGSAVVEMSYIIPMILFLFVMIIHAVFYYHDKAVLNGAAGETAVLGAQTARRKGTEYDLEEFFHNRTEGKLIYMTDPDVSVEEDEESVTVKASAARSFMRLSIYQRALIVKPEEKIRFWGEEIESDI